MKTILYNKQNSSKSVSVSYRCLPQIKLKQDVESNKKFYGYTFVEIKF